jgi:hypothetical protein
MRDSVVSEYAIADLRGKTDAQVIERQLCISASPFHVQLLEPAQQAGNLPEELQWPPRFCDNRPEHLDALQRKHAALFGEYPLGRDISAEARDLLRALKWLSSASSSVRCWRWAGPRLMRRRPRRFPGTRRAWVWWHLAVCLRPCIRAWC